MNKSSAVNVRLENIRRFEHFIIFFFLVLTQNFDRPRCWGVFFDFVDLNYRIRTVRHDFVWKSLQTSSSNTFRIEHWRWPSTKSNSNRSLKMLDEWRLLRSFTIAISNDLHPRWKYRRTNSRENLSNKNNWIWIWIERRLRRRTNEVKIRERSIIEVTECLPNDDSSRNSFVRSLTQPTERDVERWFIHWREREREQKDDSQPWQQINLFG